MNNKTEQVVFNGIIPETLAGLRLDQALVKMYPEYSRGRLQDWIKKQYVQVNGEFWQTKDKVAGGEQVDICAEITLESPWHGQEMPLDIVFEDDALLIINKPPGLVVHPAVGNRDSTLVNALLHHEPGLTAIPRCGIIHRLDKDTSGLLVVPKTLTAHSFLVNALQNREIKREYEAIVCGPLISGATIDEPIGRHPVKRKLMAVVDNGKPAVTHYRLIERFTAYTHIRVMLETGRTHQIRVHMAHVHHPILGDQLYNKRFRLPANASQALQQALQKFKRQALHARRLGFIHPVTKEYQEWEVPLPKDMEQLLSLLRERHE